MPRRKRVRVVAAQRPLLVRQQARGDSRNAPATSPTSPVQWAMLCRVESESGWRGPAPAPVRQQSSRDSRNAAATYPA